MAQLKIIYRKMAKSLALSAVILLMSPATGPSYATPDYAQHTRQGCKICHETEAGGTLSDTGLSYSLSGYTWPPEAGGKALLGLGSRSRSVIGFLHILSAIAWFGTIIYVHLILKPLYASKGLPKKEVRLGLLSMAVLGVTGALLTLARINDVSVLFETRWGVLLSTKIAFYLLLILSAAFVTVYIGPRLKTGRFNAGSPEDGVFDAQTLKKFDGKDGRPAYIAHAGKVYDVSGLEKWKGGVHFQHHSGEDLTEAIKMAPHGVEKLERLKVAGRHEPGVVQGETPVLKVFYFMAYMNLVVVFVVLFVVALWRWGY